MAGIMDTIKGAANDGALLSLGAVALVAGIGAAAQAGYAPKMPAIPGLGGGSYNDDTWWDAGGSDAGGQWETFGQEFEDFGGGSRSKGSRGKKKNGSKKRKASAYNQFVAQRIPQLVAQGQTPKRAMKVAAQEWSARSGW